MFPTYSLYTRLTYPILALSAFSAIVIWIRYALRRREPRKPDCLTWEEVSRLRRREMYNRFWRKTRGAFQANGLTLWTAITSPGLHSYRPPNKLPRTPDGFMYDSAAYEVHPREHMYSPHHVYHCPARTLDNRDVLVVLLSDSATRRKDLLKCLRRVATGRSALASTNHVLPMLQELSIDSYIFGVFPFVAPLMESRFANIGAALDFMIQATEGVVFLHQNLIAHQDLFHSNFLANRYDPELPQHGTRYYIIDFDVSACFDMDSLPESRVVSSPPAPWDRYVREAPPEMMTGQNFCPFRVDVWQLGLTFSAILDGAEAMVPEILDYLDARMMAATPEKRPSAQEALKDITQLLSSVDLGVLSTELPEALPLPSVRYTVQEDGRVEM